MEWLGIIFRGLFYAVSIVLMFPVIMFLRIDQRAPTVNDGVDLGYDDNDPGRDLDDE